MLWWPAMSSYLHISAENATSLTGNITKPHHSDTSPMTSSTCWHHHCSDAIPSIALQCNWQDSINTTTTNYNWLQQWKKMTINNEQKWNPFSASNLLLPSHDQDFTILTHHQQVSSLWMELWMEVPAVLGSVFNSSSQSPPLAWP